MPAIPAYVRAAERDWQKAEAAYDKARRALREKREKLHREACKRVDEGLKDESRIVDELRAAASTFESAYNSSRIQAAHEDDSALPPGTRMAEWQRPRSYEEPLPYRLTGRVGVLLIWTPESEYPDGQRWSLPLPGERYIRLLKKDGTDSRKFEKLTGWHGEWHPEGVTPDGAR